MKVGIDSYCYHRFFGEVYPDQKEPAQKMTMQAFLKRAKEMEVDGVSLESCFFPPNVDMAWFQDLKAQLDDYGLTGYMPGAIRMGWSGARTGQPMTKWWQASPTQRRSAQMS